MADMCSEESLMSVDKINITKGEDLKLQAKIEVKIRIKKNQLDVGRCEKDLGK